MAATTRPLHLPPGRIRFKDALQLLAVSEKTLRGRIADGMFSCDRPKGYGRGKPAFLLLSEVQYCIEHGEAAQMEAMKRKKSKQPRRPK